MNKKPVMALTITLVLGIIIGVSVTGVVFANSLPIGKSSMMGGLNSHMGIANMADHHSSDSMPEECLNTDIEDSNFIQSAHHKNMHQ